MLTSGECKRVGSKIDQVKSQDLVVLHCIEYSEGDVRFASNSLNRITCINLTKETKKVCKNIVTVTGKCN